MSMSSHTLWSSSGNQGSLLVTYVPVKAKIVVIKIDVAIEMGYVYIWRQNDNQVPLSPSGGKLP